MARNSKKYLLTDEFQQEIQDYLRKRGLAHYEFCAQVKVSPAYLSHIINGRMLFAMDDQKIQRIVNKLKFRGACFVVGEEIKQQMNYGQVCHA